jgi:hypothetical protein
MLPFTAFVLTVAPYWQGNQTRQGTNGSITHWHMCSARQSLVMPHLFWRPSTALPVSLLSGGAAPASSAARTKHLIELCAGRKEWLMNVGDQKGLVSSHSHAAAWLAQPLHAAHGCTVLPMTDPGRGNSEHTWRAHGRCTLELAQHTQRHCVTA